MSWSLIDLRFNSDSPVSVYLMEHESEDLLENLSSMLQRWESCWDCLLARLSWTWLDWWTRHQVMFSACVDCSCWSWRTMWGHWPHPDLVTSCVWPVTWLQWLQCLRPSQDHPETRWRSALLTAWLEMILTVLESCFLSQSWVSVMLVWWSLMVVSIV